MSKVIHVFLRWFPALLMMFVIFLFSAQPSSHLPNFEWADRLVKKSGHAFGYAILAFLFWRAFAFKGNRRWIAWLLALLYAFTDEFHQSFVAGRHPTIWDVIIFDNAGALISLWLTARHKKQKRPDPSHPIAEKTHL
ncbi:MAG TPA: VanZ family protein [Anaerolineales bacterium]|nr:VanZ family protein [Anaerolineales bacterium]